MQADGPSQPWTTTGERGLIAAYAVVSLLGAGLAFAAVSGLGAGAGGPLSPFEIWTIAAGAIGGAAGLGLSGELLGRPGRAGWRRAALGMVVASFAGSLVVGTLILPLWGTMFGPLALAVTLAGEPLLALIWACGLLAVHRLLIPWRRERDSIFVPLARQPGE